VFKLRWPRFSLAFKYRILFGCAVVLIIGAALYVPWYIVEALVYEQPFGEAQRVADDYFRMALANPDEAALMTTHGRDTSLLADRDQHQPRFVPLVRDLEAVDVAEGEPLDNFSRRALRNFTRWPKLESIHGRADIAGRPRFTYAHAVRVSKSCLQCHGETGRATSKYRENELAGVITVDLPADQSEQHLLFYRLGILAA